MQHYAAFHLGLHCLPKYPFKGFPIMVNKTQGSAAILGSTNDITRNKIFINVKKSLKYIKPFACCVI